jgi:hypothetical protein
MNRLGLYLLGFLAIVAACEPFPTDGASSSTGSSGATGSSGTASGLRALDAPKLCARMIDECGQALSSPDCIATFGSLRVTAACIDAIASASCADLAATSSPVLSTCFPPCTGTLATCNADGTLTYCTLAGTSQVADCHAACLADGYTSWSGTCGTTFEGQTSERAQCWCK